jgi:hypothetical protein
MGLVCTRGGYVMTDWSDGALYKYVEADYVSAAKKRPSKAEETRLHRRGKACVHLLLNK